MTLDMRIHCLCGRILSVRPTLAMQRLAVTSPRGERLLSVGCKCGRVEWIHAGDVQEAREVVDAGRLTA